MPITVGMTGEAKTLVVQSNTAAAVGSGLLPVFATPMMIALMENAAVNAIQGVLEPSEGSVGTFIQTSHDAATPLGMTVTAKATVTAVEGRAISFDVEAFDEAGPIGKGTHRRFLIANEKFMAKTNAKGK